MYWESEFDDEVLQRGRTYFEEGRVNLYNHNRNKYTFLVKGSKSYWVRVFWNQGTLYNMDCTCAHAVRGFNCKHMAAALYHLTQEEEEKDQWRKIQQQRKEEEERLRREKILKTVLPEDIRNLCLESRRIENPAGTYAYYDCKSMMEAFKWQESDVKEAWMLAENGHIQLEGIQTGFPQSQSYYRSDMEAGTMIGIANGMAEHKNSVYPLQIQFQRRSIHTAVCQVPGCGCRYESYLGWGHRDLCKHQKALFMLMYREMQKNTYGDATTEEAYTFLNQFKKKHANRVLSESQNMKSAEELSLYPKLMLRSNSWSLSFKIGNQKSYVVKNIPTLVKQVQNHENVTFGSKTTWNVGWDHLSEEGKRYYEYLRKNVEEEWERKYQTEMDNPRYVNDMIIKDSIPMFGHRLDEFRQLLGNRKVEVVDNRGGDKSNYTLAFREAIPKLRLTITKQMDEHQVFHGISIIGTVPVFVKGDQYLYYADSKAIYYFDKSEMEELEPFLATARHGEIHLNFGRNQLSSFYYSVLPWLKKYAEIIEEDTEVIEKHLPPEVAFTYYLDTENGNLYCTGEAAYGDWKLPMADMIHKTDRYTEKQSFRDVAREEEAVFWMYQYFNKWDSSSLRAYCDDEDQIYETLSEGVSKLMEIGEVQVSDAFNRLKIQKKPKISVGVSVKSSIMDLTVTSEDLSQQELLDLLRSYRKKKKYHRLKNGDYVSLESESVEVLDQMMDTLHISDKEFSKGKMQIPAYRALYLDKMLESLDSAYVDRDKHFKTLIKDFKTVTDADYEVPEPLQKVLRGYQKDGYRWLCTLDTYGLGGILADDMGLGKTLQVITFLLSKKGSGVSLIVAPASLVYNWSQEIQRFAPELQVKMITGSQAERRENLETWKSQDVLITSYDLLKRDIAEYADKEFAYEIIDEAQYIKNHTTAAAKAVKVIKSRVRFALTGTPIENRLSELWSIFDYLMPGYLYAYDAFRKEMEMPIVKKGEEDISQRLKRMVSPFILRRLKEQVLKDLPEKLEEVRYAKLEADQQRLYDGQVVHMKQMLEATDESDFQKRRIQILAELTKIRQICCNPALCLDGYTGTSAKTEACMELIQSAIEGEHKMLLFSQFTSMLEILEQRLEAAGIAYYKITGNTPKEERLRLVNAFNADATPIFLISLKAGGTGLNLTGADVVIHYDPWWNMAVQNQATDRAHRIGQQKVVTVYKLIVKDSIEERIQQMQEAKKNLADEILSGENGNIGSLSKEDMLALLEN